MGAKFPKSVFEGSMGFRGNVRGLSFNGRRPEAEIDHQVRSYVKLPSQTDVKLL